MDAQSKAPFYKKLMEDLMKMPEGKEGSEAEEAAEAEHGGPTRIEISISGGKQEPDGDAPCAACGKSPCECAG